MNIQEVYDAADKICALVQKAGDAILELYQKPGLKIDYKEDDSPVTEADFLSNEIIKTGLKAMFPDIPMVSEENLFETNVESAKHKLFWSLDPLDGTKNFISGKELFTTNLALISNGIPVFGVLNMPLVESLYCGFQNIAFKIEQGVRTKLSKKANNNIVEVVISDRADKNMVKKMMQILSPKAKIVCRSSAYKYCIVAEGKADFFPCCNYTYEWDTAAGHAIIRATGGSVITLDGVELIYGNVKQKFVNPYFLVLRDKTMITEKKLQDIVAVTS
jgi:3'(2'), 5'-bisphosphate nucleotidase